jgi:DNA-binding transcriptional LysR family regulator
MLDWDDLRIFLAVSRDGSLSAAARTLRLTQPTVGRRITAFERKLGAKLFAHHAAGRTLTRTGQRLLEHAQQMELDALAAERLASGRDVGLRGRVTITASEWMLRNVVGPHLAPFLASHPELEIELLAEARHVNLSRGEADLAIRPSRFEHREIFEREIAVLSFGLYASDSYLAAHGVPDFSNHCDGHALVAMSESLTKVPDVDWLPQVASKARIAARSNGREPMVTMAVAGIGIACLPRFVGDATPGLRLLPAPFAPARKLWLGAHREARAIPRVKATSDFLAEAFQRLRPALAPAPTDTARM